MNDSSFVFWYIFVITLIGSMLMLALEDVDGAGTPIWEPDGYMIDEVPINGWNVPHAARGPNNIIYRVWQDDDYAIRVSYTANNGSSWVVSTVIASTFEGMTSASIGGIVILANNTTCVYFTTYQGEDDYNSYVAFRWNWAGFSWEIREIYGGGAAVTGYPKMALNGTHLLFMSLSGTNTLRGKTYNLATDTFSTGPGTTPSVWDPSDGNSYDYDITVNMSGKFIIAAETWSGSTYRYYIRDYDKDHAAIYANTDMAVSEVYAVNLMCRSDDTLVIGHTVYWYGMGYWGLQVMRQATPWGGFSRVMVNWADDYELFLPSLGSCIDDDDFITFYWANDTGGGGATYISKMTGEGEYTEAQWEAAIVDGVYDYGTDDDEWYASSWYDGRYPLVGGYSVNIPNAGWMGHHIWMDEVGSPDDYAFALYWNATFHWYDWEPPEEPEEPEGDPGRFMDFPAPSLDTLVAGLWWIFMVMAMMIAVLDVIMTVRKKASDGGKI